MIRVGFKLKAFNPKVVANDTKLVFQVSDKGKDGKYRYATVMCDNNDTYIGMQDKEEVKLEEITGVSQSEYMDKTQITIFAKVTRLAQEDEMQYSGKIEISEDDLPF